MKDFLKLIGRGLVRTGIYVYCEIVYRAETFGRENIPKEGALIFCGNHRNYLEPPLMVTTAKRNVRFIGKEELRKNRMFRLLGIVFNAIYVKRDSKDIGAIKEIIKGLKNGDCIAMFPEGTRNGIEKGEKVKGGAVYFALKTGAKIVPCGFKGGLKKGEKVTITYGKPMDFSQYADSKDNDIIDKLTEEMMNEIQRLAK